MLQRIVSGALWLVGRGSATPVRGPEETIGGIFGQILDPSSKPVGEGMPELLSNQFLTSALSSPKIASATFHDDSTGIEFRISRVVSGAETRSTLPKTTDKCAGDTRRHSLSQRRIDSTEERPVADHFSITAMKYSTDWHRYNELFIPEEAQEVGRYTVKVTYVSGDGHKRQLDLTSSGTAVQGQWGNLYNNPVGDLVCEGQIPIECERGFPIRPTNGVHRDVSFEIYRDGQLVGTVSGN